MERGWVGRYADGIRKRRMQEERSAEKGTSCTEMGAWLLGHVRFNSMQEVST